MAIKKGETAYVLNGHWEGQVVEDDKDNSLYMVIGKGKYGMRKILGDKKTVRDMFNERDSIELGQMSDREYRKMLDEMGVTINIKKGTVVAYQGNFYTINEDYFLTTFDKEYINNYLIDIQDNMSVKYKDLEFYGSE